MTNKWYLIGKGISTRQVQGHTSPITNTKQQLERTQKADSKCSRVLYGAMAKR